MDAAKLLNEILDHFVATGERPGDFWAFDDDYQGMGLDHRSKDGSKLWIDLERNGTIMLAWKPTAIGKTHILTFVPKMTSA